MGGTRRRTLGEDDQYDLGVVESEKHDYRRDSIESSYSYSPSRSSRDVSYGSRDSMLHSSPPRRFTRPFYLYRIPNRTMRWLCFALMSTIIIFILSLTRMGMVSSRMLEDKPPPPATWESFAFLKRYYGGIRTLTPRSENLREYPTDNISFITKAERAVPNSKPYAAYSSYRKEFPDAVECFLDAEDKITVPNIHFYDGVPLGMPEAVMGSHKLLGMSDTSCFDRYGRLGPYGFGYSTNKGGSGAGIEGEREGADDVWASKTPIDYSKIGWHDAQTRCLEKNKHRFSVKTADTSEVWREMPAKRDEDKKASEDVSSSNVLSKIPRTAIIIRTWWDYDYNPETKMYLRGLISELSLLSGGEYQVHFLVHVRNDNEPIWADPDTYNRVLENCVPEEFHGMATLWSERQMNLIYGGLPDSQYRNLPVHGVYRSAHLPLQYFAQKHPEYDYFWNWEMDARYTGHWYTLFDSLRKWAREQPRKGLWERNERFYIPEVHGTWDDFKQMARVQSEMPPQQNANKWANAGPPGTSQSPPEYEKPIWGPRPPKLEFTPFEVDPEPPTSYGDDKYTWGVGEEADLITLNPMFDPDRTDWILAEDVTAYNTTEGFPPRRTAIVTASRLSRRLLMTMHNETTFHQHTMFSEMWPATCSLHHGLKAVYAPHPVYIDRFWPVQYLVKTMNAGKNGAVGGARTTVFGDPMQHNLLGVTWHYNDGFAPNIWRRWLGYKVDNGGGEEEEIALEGRMCLPPMLLHPVKEVHLVVEGRREEGDGITT